MIDHLRHPALGFEEVTQRHFVLCRKRVLAQARRWTTEAQGTPLFKSFVRAYEELATLLSSKDLVFHRLPGQSEDPSSPWGAVQPDESDLKALASVDPGFWGIHKAALNASAAKAEEDLKPAAVENGNHDAVDSDGNVQPGQAQPANSYSGPSIGSPGDFNPWADGGTGAPAAQTLGYCHEDTSDEDLDDIYT